MICGLRDRDCLNVKTVSKTYEIGWKQITFESGRLALLANWSAVIRDCAWNYLITTTWIKSSVNEEADFFPLTVEFQEKYYAAWKIGWNRFAKRESRPSEAAILNSRIIDRPIRPMFPKWTLNEIQIISTILSSSWVSDFWFYGITWASLSLMLAWVTDFEWPVSGARIILDQNDNFKFDPTFEELKTAKLDLTVAWSMDAITMVESQWQQVPASIVLKAFDYAFNLIKQIGEAQLDFVNEYKKVHQIPEFSLTVKKPKEDIKHDIEEYVNWAKVETLYLLGKHDFGEKLDEIVEETKTHLIEKLWEEKIAEYKDSEIFDIVYYIVKKYMRNKVLTEKTRLDWRKLDEVRPVFADVDVLPKVHGSALFQRWITQALTITTLGWPGDIQIIDDMFEEETKRYIHHYNFPPFSVWEVKAMRWPSRRDIWHGRLAEKALEPVIPELSEFPYFIRAVSEIMTCNGSSSMASVCGSSLSLMDAWVPIKNMVSWVAMGMIYDETTGKYEVLSDIQAQEDFLWDLDFKVTWTDNWITALQMDCKIKWLKLEVIENVFKQAEWSLSYIREQMTKALAEPRKEVKEHAPVILGASIPVDKIREVIWKGWETIQKIVKEFEVEVDITDEWQVSVTAKKRDAGKAALQYILDLVKEIEVGDIMTWEAQKIIAWTWVIMDLGKWKSWMIHISKIAKERVTVIEDFIKVWDKVEVKVITVDKAANRIWLAKVLPEVEEVKPTTIPTTETQKEEVKSSEVKINELI